MSDYYFSMTLGNQRSLCISPLTREELGADATTKGNGLGYYLYERDESDNGLTVLAKIMSTDAALKLYESLRDLAVIRDISQAA
jgi:hypothetical protein